MHDKMMKMLMSKKKEGKSLSDSDKKAKLQALGGMRDMASKMMGDKLKGLKKPALAAKPESKEPEGYSEGGKIGQLPEEFDRDEDHIKIEHDRDNGPRHFSDGGSIDENESHDSEDAMPLSPGLESQEGGDESLDQIVEECPEDAEQIDELIRKLEEKKQKLSQ